MSKRRNTSLAVKLASGAILVILFISVVNMQVRLRDLREEKAALEEQAADLRDSIEEINYRLSEEANDQYIERYARKTLHYCYPSEILFYNDVAD